MATVTVVIKLRDDDGTVNEWTGTYDLDTSRGNTLGLIDRVRILTRREMIRRSLIVGTKEDRAK